ncbi:precorrin-6A/cobalt-precorrin-6A reductase [Candidatus Puniceispirillum marinum]|uniref:Precorrin-6x reductase n=1 Tax=Puniceispirillum marinum (strain IMCC1322) TaxID=488538 RepID=D5BRA3_PUNMI|nr:precorrin-6A/cobalt-precorrin-6A reductase [Candidatus Puniceispirillum marinum]ADE38800.1 precorrin-6x reductase [Candidatus Puniceispirillum marinum IMCC1322]
MHLLILAGTSEARFIIGELKDDVRFTITASLAGVTPSPIDLLVPTRKGGFGGASGLAGYCATHNVDAIIDLTHPYATQMSQNAHAAATMSGVKLIRYMRPAWQAGKGDHWRYFDSWTEMAQALPAGARVFLAGGSAALPAFQDADHIDVLARGLKTENVNKSHNFKFIESLPNKMSEDEEALFKAHAITHICAKNSGGNASIAKLHAARSLALPVWLLTRPKADMQDNTSDQFISGDIAEILRHIKHMF